jgi:hypothetical protein
LNIGEITSFHADVESGGWEMTVRSYGDCSGLARQNVIMLMADFYWNGTKDTFGGYSSWEEGLFVGLVDRLRMVHEDNDTAYLEVTLVSPETVLNFAEVEEMFWATSGSDEEITVADLKVLDLVWGLFQECRINDRFNVFMFAGNNSITNLKLSRGPVWDVAADIAARTYFVIYAARDGSIYVRPDINIRWATIYGSLPTEEFTFTTQYFMAIDYYSQDVDYGDPPDPEDQTIRQVVMTAIQSDLTEIWARYPSDENKQDGKTVEVGGLICETATTLETWAGRYWFGTQPEVEADLYLAQFPACDLYMPVALTFTPDSTRLTNTGLTASNTPPVYYVTSVDYQLDPGMQRMQGTVHIRSVATMVDYTNGVGENSSD